MENILETVLAIIVVTLAFCGCFFLGEKTTLSLDKKNDKRMQKKYPNYYKARCEYQAKEKEWNTFRLENSLNSIKSEIRRRIEMLEFIDPVAQEEEQAIINNLKEKYRTIKTQEVKLYTEMEILEDKMYLAKKQDGFKEWF